MDEILELQQQLAAAQKGSTAQKLSERNCVELVMKLQALKLVDLIFTRSGREYLTHKQLVIEIEDELLARGGRVNVIDLPEALNVDLVHIQSKLPEIIAASDNRTRLVRGELLTDYYLASVAEEINDALTSSEHGLDNIGSIASRYALPVDVVRETVATHVNSVINASLDAQNPDILRSAASIARDRAATRGMLRATTAPTALADLARLRELPLALVATLVEEMLEEGSLVGSRVGRGARAVFVPAVFARAAVQAASSAFVANGFVALDRLAKMHIPDARAFVAEHLSDAVILDESIVGPALIDTLATSAAEAVSGAGWLDVAVSLPPDFPQGDVAAVMTRLVSSLQADRIEQDPGMKSESGKSSRSRRKGKSASAASSKVHEQQSAGLVFGGCFIVSPSLTKSLSDALEADAVQRAEERARLMTERMAMVVSQTGTETSEGNQSAPSAPAESGKKNKGKGRRRAGAKEKNSNSGAGNGSTAATNGADADFPISKPSPEEAIDIVLADDSWAAAIQTDYLGSSTAGEEMLTCLLEEMYGEGGLAAVYQGKAEEAVANLVRERALAKKNAEKALLTGLEEAELYWRSADTLPVDELASASKSWVINEICVNALCRIVDSVAQSTGIVESSIAHAHELSSKKAKLEVLRAVMPKLAPTLESKIRALISAIGDSEDNTVENFLALYDENVTLLDLPERRPLDKKGERAAFSNARARLTLSLEEGQGTEMECLETAVILVHSKTCGGSIIMFPPESVMGFCKVIEETARPAEAGAALRELREAIISKEEDHSEGPAGAVCAEFAEKLTALRGFIG